MFSIKDTVNNSEIPKVPKSLERKDVKETRKRNTKLFLKQKSLGYKQSVN